MAIQNQGAGGAVAEVGQFASSPLHTVSKPLPAVGHYRYTHRMALIALQAASSRLFEIRNPHATNLMVVTSITLKWLQTAAHTAAIENSIDVYKATGFSAVDTTATVTPTEIKGRTSMAASNFAVRGATVAGVAGGMTGGTVTLDAAPFAQLPQWLLLAQPTAGPVPPAVLSWAPDEASAEYPLVLAQNEGIVIANRVVAGAAAGSSLYMDVHVAEVTAF